MSKRREQRRAKALAFLRRQGEVSALDLGLAAVEGETGAKFIPWRHKERIGLQLASAFVRCRKAAATPANRFRYLVK